MIRRLAIDIILLVNHCLFLAPGNSSSTASPRFLFRFVVRTELYTNMFLSCSCSFATSSLNSSFVHSHHSRYIRSLRYASTRLWNQIPPSLIDYIAVSPSPTRYIPRHTSLWNRLHVYSFIASSPQSVCLSSSCGDTRLSVDPPSILVDDAMKPCDCDRLRRLGSRKNTRQRRSSVPGVSAAVSAAAPSAMSSGC